MSQQPTNSKSPAGPLQPDEFVRLVMENEGRIFAYVASIMPGSPEVEDVVQDVITLMWEKIDDFERGSHFGAWACRIAYFKVLELRRSQGIRRALFLSDELRESLAADAVEIWDDLQQQSTALEKCLDRLDDADRQMVLKRYGTKGSLKETAALMGKSEVTARKWIRRVLARLEKCISLRLGLEL
ncbi:sigma-70 family RNA polymerase sigma factor [Blastopirellula sp. JC732]|uniref:Sigma-70 family RNA polymerase sigma factor n=1 Tax=Blastopirellula sediminis TaxID=2894196 RepID=A0A9X1MMI9_9BACT|nr:sigma-70 family RNA polymerase sigma factor [Blastopirellula sediminis]MCC9606820.1 sigma-70 family RNA polymerase sigma factor [Blastopirellula sediminis]MCC9629883.1 sigma-70 family RNA polymerase sigma factor [Blastopirellula sediminis]